jgi:hypothetical protein
MIFMEVRGSWNGHTTLFQETLKADYEGNRFTAIVEHTLTFFILFRIQGYRMWDDASA